MAFQKGHVMSEETRKKISETMKAAGVHAGKNNPMYGRPVSDETRQKRSDAMSGRKRPPEQCKNISESKKGENNPMYGRTLSEEERRVRSVALIGYKRSPGEIERSAAARRGQRHSEESKRKMSIARQNLSDEARKNIALARIGKSASFETRRKMSESRRGENNPCWRGGVSFNPYCEKFNDACKERVREEFGRKCLNCGLPESENKTRGGICKRLSVHHIYYDKMEGCNGKEMFLAPLCMKCHNKTTTGDRLNWMQLLSKKREQYYNSH